MPNKAYTLEDLERLTGFTRRQIRFYITKKMVPGAGEKRGPYAVYSDETLAKLLAIVQLKDRRVPPAGRQMTLEEIGHALDSVSTDIRECTDNYQIDESQVDPVANLSFHARHDVSSASDYIEGIRAKFTDDPDLRESAPRGVLRHSIQSEPTLSPASAVDDPEQELHDLLSHLQSLLHKLGGHSRHIAPEGIDQWQRITTDDIEIHVRQPNDHRAKARLAAMARALARLLSGEEEA